MVYKLRKFALGLLLGCSVLGINSAGCIPSTNEVCASVGIECDQEQQNLETEPEASNGLKLVAIY